MKRKKIIAFAGSNSSISINKKLVDYAVAQLGDYDIELLDLNDFEMPILSEDRERVSGVPAEAHEFIAKLASADAFLISLAEHNGNITVALKNILDWSSRVQMNLFDEKPVLLMGTSTGRGGARSSIEIGVKQIARFKGTLVDQFSLPSFNYTFKEGVIIDDELRAELHDKIKNFQNVLVGQEVQV